MLFLLRFSSLFSLMVFFGVMTIVHSMEMKYPCAYIDSVNVSESFFQDILENKGNAIINKPDSNTNNNNTINNKKHFLNIFNPQGSNLLSNININGSRNNSNVNNNLHDFMEDPHELLGFYDFVIENGVRVSARRHLRACICKLKPCIRFCCPHGHYYDVTSHACNSKVQETIKNNTNQNKMLVRSSNNTNYQVNTTEHFSIYIGTPCSHMGLVLKDQKELIPWILYENGTISYNRHVLSRHYCYTPYQLTNKTWIWQPLLCATEKLQFVLGAREWTFVISLILAAICMCVILFIYLCCTEMRNTFYGVAIKAYCICIICGYSLLAHLKLNDPYEMPKLNCVFIAGFILLFLLLSYYILTFVSFNFYLNYHDVVLTKLMFWLIFFPICSLAICWSLFVSLTHYGRKLVFAGDTCWFDPRNLSIMVYYYAPIFVACAVCIFFYILTRIRITEQQESSASKNEKDIIEENRYQTFWRFFVYTLIMLTVHVISIIVNYHRNDRTFINYAVCLAVALHGICSLYTLVGQNQQVQNFLRRVQNDMDDCDDNDDDEIRQSALPMTPLERD